MSSRTSAVNWVSMNLGVEISLQARLIQCTYNVHTSYKVNLTKPQPFPIRRNHIWDRISLFYQHALIYAMEIKEYYLHGVKK